MSIAAGTLSLGFCPKYSTLDFSAVAAHCRKLVEVSGKLNARWRAGEVLGTLPNLCTLEIIDEFAQAGTVFDSLSQALQSSEPNVPCQHLRTIIWHGTHEPALDAWVLSERRVRLGIPLKEVVLSHEPSDATMERRVRRVIWNEMGELVASEVPMARWGPSGKQLIDKTEKD